MALPVLNEHPKYEVVIPSSNTKTTFRPYLVKEEKVLLMASETGDENLIAKATIDLIKSCVDEKLDEKNITIFDMEYLFCQIRAKSVGETANVILYCNDTSCLHENMVSISLDKVQVKDRGLSSNIIDLTPEVKIEMRYPSYYGIANNEFLSESESDIEKLYHTILSCIKAIQTDDERILADNETYEELVNFVNNMTSEQYEKLRAFVLTSPMVSLDHNWTCEKCGKNQTSELKGLQDFF